MKAVAKLVYLILGMTAWASSLPSWSAEGDSPSANLASRGLTLADFPRWHEVAPGIFSYEDTLTAGAEIFTTNSLIVVTREGVVIVDGQGGEDKGKALISAIKRMTPQPVKYLIIASDHVDHVGANATLKAAWPDMIFISSPASRKTMVDQKREGVATELVSDRKVLDVGGTSLEILNIGRGHTGGDLVVHLPQHGILFMSELYDRNIFPPMVTAFPTEWVRAVDKALAMNVERYIPGHGYTDGEAVELKRDLKAFRDALSHIVAEARRLRDLGLACRSEKDCPAHEQAEWTNYAQWTAASRQSARALARAYAELEGRLPQSTPRRSAGNPR